MVCFLLIVFFVSVSYNRWRWWHFLNDGCQRKLQFLRFFITGVPFFVPQMFSSPIVISHLPLQLSLPHQQMMKEHTKQGQLDMESCQRSLLITMHQLSISTSLFFNKPQQNFEIFYVQKQRQQLIGLGGISINKGFFFLQPLFTISFSISVNIQYFASVDGI